MCLAGVSLSVVSATTVRFCPKSQKKVCIPEEQKTSVVGSLNKSCDARDMLYTDRKNHNKSTITDCKLFSESHCRQLLYLPRPPHLWYNSHCTRNIVTTQLQYRFVNYFHNIFGAMVHFFLQCMMTCPGLRRDTIQSATLTVSY